MMYQAYSVYTEALQPFNHMARAIRSLHKHPFNPFRDNLFTRHITAGLEIVERMTAHYEKPSFDIDDVEVDGVLREVQEKVVLSNSFRNLIHFRKYPQGAPQPRLLIVAPLSGHYATLLRDTVERFLPELDVYITDWVSAREVPLSQGQLGLDDFVDSIMESIRFCGKDTHVLAICQPTVPLVMALAVMSEADDLCVPATTTLIAGPVDARINPTAVNEFATTHDYEWFERNAIHKVPFGFVGEGQPVYPGFLQLAGFLSMNIGDHMTKHVRFYNDLVEGNADSSEAHRHFYDEYLAVMDISARFYLETIKRVFIDADLPQGLATYRGKPLDLDAIEKTALFTIEGEQDDICGLGQTEAAQHICKNIPDAKRQHYVQHSVGHYGVWNGRHFREDVAPKVIDFIHKNRK